MSGGRFAALGDGSEGDGQEISLSGYPGHPGYSGDPRLSNAPVPHGGLAAQMSKRPPPPMLETVLVDTLGKAAEASNELLKCKIVSVDCEGVKLSRTGRLCLVQVASKTKVFLFDVVKIGGQAFYEGGLGPVLESKKILKLMHDCRHDSDALHWQFGVTLQNVFDTQVAFAVLREQQGNAKPIPIGLKSLLRKFSNTTVEEENTKAFVKEQMNNNSNFWLDRPLSAAAVAYAKLDVQHLMNVHRQMKKYLKESGEQMAMEGSEVYLRAYRDHADGAEQAQREFDEQVKQVQEEKKQRDEQRKEEQRQEQQKTEFIGGEKRLENSKY